MAKEKNEKSYKGLMIRIIVAIIFLGLLFSTYFIKDDIETYLNSIFYP